MRSATQEQKRRSVVTPRSALLEAGDQRRVARGEQNAEHRNERQHGDKRNDGRQKARLAESSDQIRVGDQQAEERQRPAVAWVRTQAGPTTLIASRNAVRLSTPAIMPSRAAKVSCMLSEKLITMMSGVIAFRNIFRRKPSQPSAPSAETIASAAERRRRS